jgi:hypothetical protein
MADCEFKQSGVPERGFNRQLLSFFFESDPAPEPHCSGGYTQYTSTVFRNERRKALQLFATENNYAASKAV